MNPDSPLIHSKHVFRAAILLLVGVVALILGRSLFVPDTWGESGWYRGAAVMEHRAKPVRHGGDQTCEPCHDIEYAEQKAGVHAPIRCELCHGPVALHVDLEEGEKLGDMPIRRNRELCELCHREQAARPAEFPQIDVRQHLIDYDVEPSPEVCFDCHEAHSPF